MTILKKDKTKLRMIINNLNISNSHKLITEEILAMIWSYRNSENGLYYSNFQLAEMNYCKEMKIKTVMKNLRESGLVTWQRRHNSSTLYKPSKKLIHLLKEKDISCPSLIEKDINRSSEGHNMSAIPSLKGRNNRETDGDVFNDITSEEKEWIFNAI